MVARNRNKKKREKPRLSHPRLAFRNSRPYTLNLVPGKRVYGERLVNIEGKEYREWDPTKSKLSAAILKGLSVLPIPENSTVLYLGAASGTTASHVSDLVGEKGLVYGVEFAPRVAVGLVLLAKKRANLVPVFCDARKPHEYLLSFRPSIIYQDVAQRDQVEILEKNVAGYLEKGDTVLFALKARSIDSVSRLSKIYKSQEKKMEKFLEIIERIDLEPYHREHRFYYCRVL